MITKVLTLCQQGAVRSVTLAWVLRVKYKLDTIPQSYQRCSKETLEMLYEWADKIMVVEEDMKDEVPEPYYTDKTVVVDIGPDIWKQSLHPDLVDKIVKLLDSNKKLLV